MSYFKIYSTLKLYMYVLWPLIDKTHFGQQSNKSTIFKFATQFALKSVSVTKFHDIQSFLSGQYTDFVSFILTTGYN